MWSSGDWDSKKINTYSTIRLTNKTLVLQGNVCVIRIAHLKMFWSDLIFGIMSLTL
jgi:hypothetical protein